MAYELSPQSEQYLASIVADGLYPSKQAALEAAVATLREKDRPLPMVPDNHLDAVEKAIASADAGNLRELTPTDWSRLRGFVNKADDDLQILRVLHAARDHDSSL